MREGKYGNRMTCGKGGNWQWLSPVPSQHCTNSRVFLGSHSILRMQSLPCSGDKPTDARGAGHLSQSFDYTFSSHLGLIRYPTLILYSCMHHRRISRTPSQNVGGAEMLEWVGLCFCSRPRAPESLTVGIGIGRPAPGKSSSIQLLPARPMRSPAPAHSSSMLLLPCCAPNLCQTHAPLSYDNQLQTKERRYIQRICQSSMLG